MFVKRIDSFYWPFVDNETHEISWYNCYYVRNYYIVGYIVIITPRYLEDYIENDEWKIAIYPSLLAMKPFRVVSFYRVMSVERERLNPSSTHNFPIFLCKIAHKLSALPGQIKFRKAAKQESHRPLVTDRVNSKQSARSLGSSITDYARPSASGIL